MSMSSHSCVLTRGEQFRRLRTSLIESVHTVSTDGPQPDAPPKRSARSGGLTWTVSFALHESILDEGPRRFA